MIILTNFIKIVNLFKVNKNKLFPFFNMSKIWPKKLNHVTETWKSLTDNNTNNNDNNDNKKMV